MKYSLTELLYLMAVRIPTTIIGKYFRHNLVKVHWGRSLNNFGDCLQPDILRHYGLTPVFVQQKASDLVLAGSILQCLPKNYSGLIIGTGGDDYKYDFPKAKVLAVRGKKTLHNFEIQSDILLGDPGLLMPLVFKFFKSHKYRLGIIPHFVDAETEPIRKWRSKFGADVLFINVLRKPKEVIEDIVSCDFIASSSLHGLIIADAYHIANVRFVNRETMPTYFYDYKFDDYYSSLGIKDEYIEITGEENELDLIKSATLKPIEKIEELKNGLNNLMVRVSRQFRKP